MFAGLDPLSIGPIRHHDSHRRSTLWLSAPTRSGPSPKRHFVPADTNVEGGDKAGHRRSADTPLQTVFVTRAPSVSDRAPNKIKKPSQQSPPLSGPHSNPGGQCADSGGEFRNPKPTRIWLLGSRRTVITAQVAFRNLNARARARDRTDAATGRQAG